MGVLTLATIKLPNRVSNRPSSAIAFEQRLAIAERLSSAAVCCQYIVGPIEISPSGWTELNPVAPPAGRPEDVGAIRRTLGDCMKFLIYMELSVRSYACVVVAAVALSACAPKPENVAAVPQSTAEFSGMSCKSLATKRVQVQQTVDATSAKQSKAAGNDAIGVLLLGVPLASMSGADAETELAVAKGRLNAIDEVRARKGCGN